MTKLSSLRPPVVEITPAIEWTLAAAFASKAPTGPDLELRSSLEPIAGRLGLIERIAARHSRRALPASVHDRFRQRLNRSIATCLLYEDLAHAVAKTASELALPVVFLKGFALFLYALTPAGSRPFGDLDVLVPKEAAGALFDALREQGFEPVPGVPTEQHLAGLRSPRGGLLEIHFALRGLRDDGGRAAHVETLKRWNAVSPLADFEGEAFKPTQSLLAAHLLVHAMQQHLLRPQTYALFRLIADLSDLLPEHSDWESFNTEWRARYRMSVDPDDVETIRGLCEALREGSLPKGEVGSDGATLLRHLLAGSLVPAYAESLAPRYLRNRLLEASRRGELGEYLKRKVLPSSSSPPETTSEEPLVQRLLRALRDRIWRPSARQPPR